MGVLAARTALYRLGGRLGGAVRLVAASLALLGAGGAVAQVAPDLVGSKYGERRAYFSDWLASCRPDGSCHALTYIGAEGDFFDHAVRVSVPRAGADMALVIAGPRADAGSATIALRVDGGPTHRLPPGEDLGWANAPGDAANEFRISQSKANLSVIPEMKAGRFLTARWAMDEREIDRLQFSLRGLTAALAWIEAHQAP
ncbi:MAG: hypothetical protein AAFW46_02465 [Pseudomonadota bacterium]